MCITIPSSANVKRAHQWVVWRWLSASPLRLYLIGGGLMLVAALAGELAGLQMAAGWDQFNLLFALVPVLLLGASFEWMPGLLRVTPLTYVRFSSLFFLLLLSQLLFHADALLGEVPGLFYLLTLGLVWSLSLMTLRGMLRRSYVGLAGMAGSIVHLLLLAGVAGLGIAIGLVGGWLPLLPAYAWIGLAPIYLFAFLALIYLTLKGNSLKFT